MSRVLFLLSDQLSGNLVSYDSSNALSTNQVGTRGLDHFDLTDVFTGDSSDRYVSSLLTPLFRELEIR